jgi:molybdopterin synthase catalytic subunit
MFQLTDEPIDLSKLINFVTQPASGAIATFIGTTRDHNQSRKVLALSYEAYPGMAEKELEQIGMEAKGKWNIERMAIVHRTGHVGIGEMSVAIAVSAAHRDDAFAACRFAIEEIKRRVPIWKKELFEGGEVWIGTQSGEPFTNIPKPTVSAK